MSHYADIREAGPRLNPGRNAAQPDLAEHAAFMNDLAAAGVVLFASPLAGTENERLRALLIVNANADDEIRQRLARDPRAQADRLSTVTIGPWNIIVGAERLSAVASGTAARGGTRLDAISTAGRRRRTTPRSRIPSRAASLRATCSTLVGTCRRSLLSCESAMATAPRCGLVGRRAEEWTRAVRETR